MPGGAHPAFLDRSELLSYDEVARVARAGASLGVRRLRITGGEPLLRRDLAVLIGLLAALPGELDISLTTNGERLAADAAALRDAGLRRVTVSLDAIDDAVYRAVTGVPVDVAWIVSGIDAARAVGLAPVKLNAVIKRGLNESEILPLARFARERGLVVRYIEYMDAGQLNDWRPEDVVPAAEIVDLIDRVMPLEPVSPAHPGEVATRWRYRDGGGEIGTIAAVSQPFCAACTRLRLTPDGHLVTCLFAERSHDLRGLLRAAPGDDPIAAAIRAAWTRRDDRYSEVRTTVSGPRPRREMFAIGG
jgi:cyclic pyranopterin phosphate synthase